LSTIPWVLGVLDHCTDGMLGPDITAFCRNLVNQGVASDPHPTVDRDRDASDEPPAPFFLSPLWSAMCGNAVSSSVDTTSDTPMLDSRGQSVPGSVSPSRPGTRPGTPRHSPSGRRDARSCGSRGLEMGRGWLVLTTNPVDTLEEYAGVLVPVMGEGEWVREAVPDLPFILETLRRGTSTPSTPSRDVERASRLLSALKTALDPAIIRTSAADGGVTSLTSANTTTAADGTATSLTAKTSATSAADGGATSLTKTATESASSSAPESVTDASLTPSPLQSSWLRAVREDAECILAAVEQERAANQREREMKEQNRAQPKEKDPSHPYSSSLPEGYRHRSCRRKAGVVGKGASQPILRVQHKGEEYSQASLRSKAAMLLYRAYAAEARYV
ncbi:hypothetical protein KIPB_009263, partial [Kipferlia bialata]